MRAQTHQGEQCPACFCVLRRDVSPGLSTRELIVEGRRRLKMSTAAFAREVGVSRGAVQQWERIGGTAPRYSGRARVAALLGMSLAEFNSGGPQPPLRLERHRAVFVIADVEAGGYAAIDNFSQTGGLERVMVTVQVGQRTFALRVHGDSMVGSGGDSFPQGTIVVVEPDMHAQPGDFVIALNVASQATFKQLVLIDGGLFLKPLNKRFRTRPLGSARVLGVVRESIRQFR
jgi:SOS-response transcriptional repressor LexA